MNRSTPLVCTAVALCACTTSPASARVEVGSAHTASSRGEARSHPTPHPIASVRSGAAMDLRARPFGPVLARVGDPPGQVGWIKAIPGRLRYSQTPLELEVDLSRRTLIVRRGASMLRRIVVDVGRPESPTPTGRFAVTDKLAGANYSPSYGCCILALSARQTHLPRWWHGGDRIAIHGTQSSDFGRAISTGCVRAPESALRYLMRTVALGAPVVIHP